MKRVACVTLAAVLAASMMPAGAVAATDGEVVSLVADVRDGTTRVLVSHGTGPDLGSAIALTRTATPNRSGDVSLRFRITPAERAAAARNGGWLNYHAMTIDEAARPVSFTSFTRYVGTDPAFRRRAEDRGTRVEFRSGTDAAARAAAAPSYTNCTNYRWEVEYTDWNFMAIGEGHVASDGTVKFVYGSRADSDVGVAYSDNGGPWYLSGEAHAGNALSREVSITGGPNFGRRIVSQFNYAQLFLLADCLEGYDRYMGRRAVEVTSWRGGITYDYDWRNLDNQRNANWNIFGKGGAMSRTAYDFVKLSGAVSIWGASLTAQSGSSTYVETHWTFGSARNAHYLYGNDSTPPYAHRVFASDN